VAPRLSADRPKGSAFPPFGGGQGGEVSVAQACY